MLSGQNPRYRSYAFLVTVESPNDPRSTFTIAFQEVAGLPAVRTEPAAPRKLPGIHKTTDVTLKRGVIGDSSGLSGWIQSRAASPRKVRVQLMAPGHSRAVEQWTLTGARLIKYTGPALNAKGTDVAIEELVLGCEGIDLS